MPFFATLSDLPPNCRWVPSLGAACFTSCQSLTSLFYLFVSCLCARKKICRSEVDDINLGLQHYFGAFDVAHARLICTGVRGLLSLMKASDGSIYCISGRSGPTRCEGLTSFESQIRDYAGLVDHISHSLRGGGMIDLTEYNFVIHDGNKKRFVIPENDINPQGPWLPRWMHLAQQAIRTRGGEVEAADHLERWVADHGAFENVVHRSFWFQASPWNTGMDPESVRQNEIAKVMREDMLVRFGCSLRISVPPANCPVFSFSLLQQFLKAGRPLLLGSGIEESMVNLVEEKATQELMEARTPLYILIENVYARKRHDF